MSRDRAKVIQNRAHASFTEQAPVATFPADIHPPALRPKTGPQQHYERADPRFVGNRCRSGYAANARTAVCFGRHDRRTIDSDPKLMVLWCARKDLQLHRIPKPHCAPVFTATAPPPQPFKEPRGSPSTRPDRHAQFVHKHGEPHPGKRQITSTRGSYPLGRDCVGHSI